MRCVEVLDVAGELADAASGDSLGQAVAEADALEPAQLALAIATNDPGLGDRVELSPVGAQALDRLGAVADEAAALQLEHAERSHELGLERRAELGALAQHHLGDRDRVAGIGLARALAVALAMGAPGRHVQHLVAAAASAATRQRP